MARNKKRAAPAPIEAPEVILTEVQEWARDILNSGMTTVDLDATLDLFTDMCPEPVPVAMAQTFLAVAESADDVRRATFFMRRFQDAIFTRELRSDQREQQGDLRGEGLKMNAHPSGPFNPVIV